MKIYAERPGRLTGQVLFDLAVVAWIGGWVLLGTAVHDRIDALRRPVFQVGEASEGISTALSGTGDQIRNLQFIGEVLVAPFDAIVNGAGQLVQATNDGQSSIAQIADLAVPAVAVLPITVAVLVWLVTRARWMRRATAAARMRGSAGGQGLLAAQALQAPRLDRLIGVVDADDPLGDAASRRHLAGFTLQHLGLKGYDRASEGSSGATRVESAADPPGDRRG